MDVLFMKKDGERKRSRIAKLKCKIMEILRNNKYKSTRASISALYIILVSRLEDVKVELTPSPQTNFSYWSRLMRPLPQMPEDKIWGLCR